MAITEEAAKLAVSEDLDKLTASIQAMVEMECDIVVSVRHKGQKGNGRCFIISSLLPEDSAEVLWYTLGNLQQIVRAMKPPTNTVQ